MQYWLVKSEPEEFSIDDLAAKKVEPWTGVRNYQARNFMREMKQGDIALFYHSSCTPPGIVGLAEVASAVYPDPTQFELESEYFDPKATPETPRWFLVDLTFKTKFKRQLTLDEIKNDPLLNHMRVAQRGSRLSVQPVTAAEFQRIETLLA